MKKLILITTILLTMNTWSASYYVCSAGSTVELEKCVNNLLERGYEPQGSMVISTLNNGSFKTLYQPMLKND
jgi:hypothetical protein